MRITTTILREPCDHKPLERIGHIQNACVHAETIDSEELADLIAQGCTFKSCDCGKRQSDFRSGMLFTLDFDNKDAATFIEPDAAIALAVERGFAPSIMYRTFSSTDQLPKFRLVFVADRPLTDRKQWEHCQSIISSIFPKGMTDHTDNCNRLFFGTNQNVDYLDTATVSVDALLDDYVEPRKPREQTPRRKAQKRRTTDTTQANCIARAIADRDSGFIRKHMGRNKPIVFDNRAQFFDYIYRTVNLADFLGVDEGTAFSCILPTHGGSDEHPSASVFCAKGGVWCYKCFSESVTLNIKQLVELVGGFDSEYQALEFLKASLNLTIKETQWSIEQIRNIDAIIDSLCGTDETAFSSICPTASKNLRNCKLLLLQILCIARKCIYPERSVDGRNIVFSMSLRRLARDMNKRSTDQIERYLKMLCYHGVIRELPDDEIPKQFLAKANANRQEGHSRVSFFEIPSWVVQRTQLIEQQGLRWKQNGYRIRGISYEMFLRTEGQGVATELYPQYSRIKTKRGVTNRRTSRKADKMHDQMTNIVISLIESKGYCTEREIAECFVHQHGRNITDAQIKRSIADIMAANCLHKQKCTKELKEQLGISNKGYPIIIVADD